MRKVSEYVHKDGRKAKVYWNNLNQEFTVKFFNHLGIHMDGSDYYTNDEADALATARVGIDDVKKCYNVVTYVWEEGKYLQRGKGYDGFATPSDALRRLAEESSMGFEFFQAFCIDEDTGVTQWELRIS